MSETNTATTPSADELAASVEKLKTALEAERAEHKATRESAKTFRDRIASGFGLADDADDDAITSRLGEVETVVTERTSAITAERDAAMQRAQEVESKWTAQRIDDALRAAFNQSGARPEHFDDFMLLARDLFTIDAEGKVVTKPDAPDTIPGTEPMAWILSDLRSRRGHYWNPSVGGGARSVGHFPTAGGDDSCFKPGATWNLTRQFEYESRFGTKAADDARRRYRGVTR